MKHLYFFICLLTVTYAIAQTPDVIYYPNTIYTPTVLGIGSVEYLCGPNTVVNDTLVHGCKIYVSNNCTLTMNTKCSVCPGVTGIFLQGNSVLNILPGNCSNFYFVSEPTATINNPMNVPISSNTITTISWPTVNCLTSGVEELKTKGEGFKIYPNPVKDKLSIEYENGELQKTKINIFNSLGLVVYSSESLKLKEEIDLSSLASGIFHLKIHRGSEQKVFKIQKE